MHEFPPLQDQFSLKGRTALVTGSSTGLGKAIAMNLGAAGAQVALNYRNNSERAQLTVLRKQGGLRPLGSRVAPHLWHGGHDDELL